MPDDDTLLLIVSSIAILMLAFNII